MNSNSPRPRSQSIDLLRGVAITFMVMANMSMILVAPHPMWFRLLSTFVAPLFVLLSGMMVAYTAAHHHHDGRYYLKHGFWLLLIACANDLLNFHLFPMISYDILYLIGFAMPVAYYFHRLNGRQRWAIIFLIFAATPLLQKLMGYSDYPMEFHVTHQDSISPPNQTNPFHHWLVDGWFPIFPWLGFSLLGVNFSQMILDDPDGSHRKKELVYGSLLTLVGGILWWKFPGAQLIRDVYGELYYPATLGFILTSIGVILLLFFLSDFISHWNLLKPILLMGRCSLFIYILHLSIITYVLSPLWPDRDLATFFLIYALVLVFLIFTSYALKRIKNHWKGIPPFIRFIIGS